jgi:ubiquinone/menaquinone biosynthesis C-methylase UbiE
MTDRKTRIVGLFERAAPTYDQLGIEFFGPPGRQLVELAGLRPGDRVLDLGSGRGASLFPAAEAVGPEGEVIGVDLAPTMIASTADEARRRGFTWINITKGDAEHPDFPESSFDAVIAGFCVFFMDDPAGAVARWGRLLRPGGRLALSTFAEHTDSTIAMYTAIEEALRAFRPEKEVNPLETSDPTRTPEWVAGLFAEAGEKAGLTDVEMVEIDQRSEYASPEVFYDFLLSAGGRVMLESIPAERQADARAAVTAAVTEHLRQPDGTFARTTGMRLTRAVRALPGT